MGYSKNHTPDQCDKCLAEVGQQNLIPLKYAYKDMNDHVHPDISEQIGAKKGSGYRQYMICKKCQNDGI